MVKDNTQFRLRASSAWCRDTDEIMHKLRLSSRAHVVDVALNLLAVLVDVPLAARVADQEDRFDFDPIRCRQTLIRRAAELARDQNNSRM